MRAPTLAEEYHTSSSVTTTGASGELAVKSAGAQLLSAEPLKLERSINFTADAYQIDIRDRILDGGTYSGAM